MSDRYRRAVWESRKKNVDLYNKLFATTIGVMTAVSVVTMILGVTTALPLVLILASLGCYVSELGFMIVVADLCWKSKKLSKAQFKRAVSYVLLLGYGGYISFLGALVVLIIELINV